MTLVHDRPVEVNDRTVPGYWEDDLIVGRGQGSAIGTLVGLMAVRAPAFADPAGAPCCVGCLGMFRAQPAAVPYTSKSHSE